MELKQCEKIEWHELPRVETPVSAHYWIRHHLHTSDVGYLSLLQVQGVREVTRDPITRSCRPWNAHTKEWLLREIEIGTVMLLNDFGMEAFDPLYRRQIDPETGEETFIVDQWAAWHAMVRHHADLALWAARETKGIFAPPPLPEQRPPEKKPKPEPEPLTVKNPRWEHVDPNVAEKRREAVRTGDGVALKADVGGVPDGTRATFKIYEASLSPAVQIGTIQGEVSGGIGTAEWKVQTPRRGTKAPVLEFDGQVRNVTSERAGIPLAPPKPPMRIGLFFDGTGNSLKGTHSNVAKLFGAYEDNKKSLFAIHKRGVGTDGNLWDDAMGGGFGAGAEARVEGMLWDIQKAIGDYRNSKESEGELPDRILLDVFGFSRGAAIARMFVNVIKQRAYTLDPPYDELPPDHFEFHFLGLFDTVGSFGPPGNDVDLGKSFAIEPAWIESRAVHLIADDEYRANFDLQSLFAGQKELPTDRVRGRFEERVVPGAHADVGGGYADDDEEHGRSNNQLSRLYLHRMHQAATEAGVPLRSLSRLVSDSEYWVVDDPVRSLYEKVTGAFEQRQGLQEAHKSLRELERGVEYAEHRLRMLGRQRAGPANVDQAILSEEWQLEQRLKWLRPQVHAQRQAVAAHFASPAEFDTFLEDHKKLYKEYIHESHAPVNTTVGMGPEVRPDGRLRREVFYKPIVALHKISPAMQALLFIKATYRPRKFND